MHSTIFIVLAGVLSICNAFNKNEPLRIRSNIINEEDVLMEEKTWKNLTTNLVKDEISGLWKKYNSNQPISFNDIENVIDILNNAGFDDFDSVVRVFRNKTADNIKSWVEEAFIFLDHDGNNKIEHTDIE